MRCSITSLFNNVCWTVHYFPKILCDVMKRQDCPCFCFNHLLLSANIAIHMFYFPSQSLQPYYHIFGCAILCLRRLLIYPIICYMLNCHILRHTLSFDYLSTVTKKANEIGGGRMHHVKTLKNAVYGSMFGSCTCRVPQTKTIPCEHMVSLVQSGHICYISLSCLQPVGPSNDSK